MVIMKRHDVLIDDLYSFALPKLDEIQLPQNVHFGTEGSKVLAKQVSKSITDALQGRGVAPKKQLGLALRPIEDDPTQPRVMLMGDSISIGYTLMVRDLLKGKANVHRPPTNCEHTQKGLDELDNWLGDKKWDVIHFNWGLHDLKYVNENWKKVLPEQGGKQVHPVKVYAKKLEQIVKKLKKTDAKLIFATTTPYPQGCAGRIDNDELAYNAAAKKIMKKYDVTVNDLHAAITPRLDEFEQPANVHFGSPGSTFLADQVEKAILKALKQK
jgi:acyl-CoA thioesterase-1